MIWRAFATAAVLLTAGTVQAQTIVTRSGEHEGFTRLVMRLPDDTDWSLTQSGTSATVNIDAPDAVFDTSRVFNPISRARLQSLAQNGPGQPLRLQLGCDCTVTSYVQEDGFLVLDIRDGGLPEPKPQYTAASSILPLAPQPSQTGYRFNFSQSAAADARMALELAAALSGQVARAKTTQLQQETEASDAETGSAVAVKPAETAEKVTLPLDTRNSPPETETIAEEAAPELPETATLLNAAPELPETGILLKMEETKRAATVNESEQRLLQQIGRAANQGLLSVAANGIPSAASTDELDPLDGSDRPLNPLDHISVTSAIDRETRLRADLTDGSKEAAYCLQDRDVAVHLWGNEDPFADQLAPLRSALVQEFDDINPADVYALAQAYIYFGFGVEARAVLTILPSEKQGSADVALLQAMAQLMDGAALPVNHPFSSQQGCEGDSAFWGVLADGAVRKSANTDAIQQTFSKLPAHLRVHLGPRISKMFAESGDPHIAEAMLRAVDRTGVEGVPEINLAEAAIAELAGDTEKVAEELTSEVAERTESAPVALIELVALSVKERKALSPDVPDLIASYELENRKTGLGAELRQAHVASLALMGEFHAAAQELKKLTESDGPQARAAALEPLMLLLAERADDVTFLQYSLVFSSQATSAEAAPVAAVLVRRLLDLGFAQQAQDLLAKLVLEPENETRRLLMAEAALELDKPHQALAELMGLEGSEANRMRAEALWRNGEYDQAGEYLLAENEANEAARGFWHSENLDAIEAMETEDSAQFETVASVTTQIGETAQNPEGLTPLAHARALVASSKGTRGGIADLLTQVGTGLGNSAENQ